MFKQSGYRKRAVYGSTAAVVLDHTDLKVHDKHGFDRVLAGVELLAQFTHTLPHSHTASL